MNLVAPRSFEHDYPSATHATNCAILAHETSRCGTILQAPHTQRNFAGTAGPAGDTTRTTTTTV